VASRLLRQRSGPTSRGFYWQGPNGFASIRPLSFLEDGAARQIICRGKSVACRGVSNNIIFLGGIFACLFTFLRGRVAFLASVSNVQHKPPAPVFLSSLRLNARRLTLTGNLSLAEHFKLN
jgi:hypothetical protein